MTTLNSSWLNIDESREQLNGLYEADRYWYLRSPQFAKTFLKPLGRLCDMLGDSVLDVGCGEGQLYPYVNGYYVGVDGSDRAIKKGWEIDPRRRMECRRFEDPQSIADTGSMKRIGGSVDVIVFGGVMEVLVKPEHRADLMKEYEVIFGNRYFIIYDLSRLDTSTIESVYPMIDYIEDEATGIDLEEVKRKRKIVVFKCGGV